MKRITISLTAAMVAAAAPANAQDVIVTGHTAVHVSYDDLNLRAPAGRAQLVNRIHAAAAMVCNDANIDPLDVRVKRQRCYRSAVRSGVAQVDKITG